MFFFFPCFISVQRPFCFRVHWKVQAYSCYLWDLSFSFLHSTSGHNSGFRMCRYEDMYELILCWYKEIIMKNLFSSFDNCSGTDAKLLLKSLEYPFFLFFFFDDLLSFSFVLWRLLFFYFSRTRGLKVDIIHRVWLHLSFPYQWEHAFLLIFIIKGQQTALEIKAVTHFIFSQVIHELWWISGFCLCHRCWPNASLYGKPSHRH